MREIIFRVWDKKSSRWFDEDLLISASGQRIYDLDEFSYEVGSEVELMQYTGRKDKNGKEIYEGDIVDITLDYRSIRCVVEYDAMITGLLLIPVGYPDDCYCWQDAKNMKVIGNIYENPELLK